jgi:glycosyltransferase involved in cell wall biosynthesis
MQLSVLVPAYNEGPRLEAAVRALEEYLRPAGYDFEVVIVDDASTDDTADVARRLAETHGRVKVLRHEANQGPCSGLKTGPSVAAGEWLLLLPVDLAIPLGDIDVLWRMREDAAIVLGYIADPGARSRWRRFQSAVYTRLINTLFRLDLRQVNYVALYRTEMLRGLALRSSGVALHAEILVRARDAGHRIRQVGLGYVPRSQGPARGGRPSVVIKTLREIVRLALRRR